MEEIIASPNKIITVSPRPRGPARCHQTSYANIKSYTRCHNIINGLLHIMPIFLMILFSHLYVGSVVFGMTLYRWSLTFLDVKLVLTLPMSFNIWLRLFKVIKLWSSQMRISTWRYYWWSICHLLMSAWCAALRKESSSEYPIKNIIYFYVIILYAQAASLYVRRAARSALVHPEAGPQLLQRQLSWRAPLQ